MRKRIRILTFLLFTVSSLLAQDRLFKPTTHIGVNGGINFSIASFKPSIKQSFLPSYAFGLVFRHVSEPNIGLQLEINSFGKGWKELIDSVGSYTRRLETISIPITAVFIAGSKTLRFSFIVGPYVSYLRDNSETVDLLEPFSRPHYYKSLESKWEFGFTGGVAAEIHTKIGGFAVRATYNHALTNIFPLNRDEFYFSASRQQVIHAGMMYFYSF
jgi:hypothetical protein